tara:strand:- start:132438 stop:133286 length:849 start_codon:yes stop_codon:yes gene_type:complete
MQEMLDKLRSEFDLGILGARIGAFIPDVIAAVLTFAFYYVFWLILQRIVRAAAKRSQLDATAASFVDAILKYGVLSIAVVSTLNQLGVHTGSLLASVGVLGLTIGFAARDALSNIISGVFIFWDRPFVIGDLVEIEDKYGRVEAITMRSTRVVTPDGKMLAIPNSTVVNSTVASYTNFPHLRLGIEFTVGTGEDLGRVEELLLEMCANDERASKMPIPVVRTVALNDYNIGMELQFWIDDERQHIEYRSEFRRKLFETLTVAKVDMPFETLRIEPLSIRQSA